MWALKAFLLGAAVLAVLLYSVVGVLGVTADVRGWESFRLSLGPLELLSFVREDGQTSFTLGSGLLVVALAGGIANLAGAALLRRRRP